MDRRNRVKPRMSRVTLAVFLFVLSLQLADATSENDPYTILGVRRTASQAEIKRAYKNLAKEWWVVRWHHPTPPLASRLSCTCSFWLDYLFPVKRLFNLLKVKKKKNSRSFFVLIFFSRHPDKNKDPNAEDMFIKISKSYEVIEHTTHPFHNVWKRSFPNRHSF